MPKTKKQNVDNPEIRTMTVEELLNSGLVGIWKDRTDIKDNVEFARELREKDGHARMASTILVDTDILVDVQRHYPPAIE